MSNPKYLRWQEPPARENSRSVSTRSKYQPVVDMLKQYPGRWALLMGAHQQPMATFIKQGKVKGFEPAGAFEATARKGRIVNGKKKWDIYVRYVGVPEAEIVSEPTEVTVQKGMTKISRMGLL